MRLEQVAVQQMQLVHAYPLTWTFVLSTNHDHDHDHDHPAIFLQISIAAIFLHRKQSLSAVWLTYWLSQAAAASKGKIEQTLNPRGRPPTLCSGQLPTSFAPPTNNKLCAEGLQAPPPVTNNASSIKIYTPRAQGELGAPPAPPPMAKAASFGFVGLVGIANYEVQYQNGHVRP